MQLEKLQVDLRPRSNAQALDLGFSLLHAHAASMYKTWLAVWLPLMALVAVLSYFFEQESGIWIFVSWWLRPLLERAPLYVLSREIFGEQVSVREALRAWPGQLKGGWFRLLTWWRPFMAGYGLYQPVWQLEAVRGKAASARLRAVGAHKTGQSAYWFGAACFGFEAVLQFGLFGLLSLFFDQGGIANPVSLLMDMRGKPDSALSALLTVAAFAFGSGVMGPVYTACCFSLYLNRRARLEAWDIEIVLRQITPSAAGKSRSGRQAALLMLLAPAVFALAMQHPAQAEAADSKIQCEVPPFMQLKTQPGPVHSADQARLRTEVKELFATDDLRGYECEEAWQSKKTTDDKPKKNEPHWSFKEFALLALAAKVMLITAAFCFVAWLLYYFRDKIPSLRKTQPLAATEVAGLDIRAESLPDDVAAAVLALWSARERRNALALLYRATLSRLVEEDGLAIARGATEGDCLRLVQLACERGQLARSRLDIASTVTTLWLNGAYGERWPDDEAVQRHCGAWNAEFGNHAKQRRSGHE
ncbi:hypothetical protein [Undibacterium sp.]|uniref:hypothetical protein n=1 Tax=Undibacterium sp. TaxID=1914977 RepID=UPI00374D434B